MAVIYKLTSPDGKIYIGCSSQTYLSRRWQRGQNYQRNKQLVADVEKFGWEAFTHEIIEEVNENDDPLLRERYWICYYKSFDPDIGYNKNTNHNTEFKKRKRAMVQCVETGEVYKTQTELAKKLGITRSYMSYLVVNKKPYQGKHYQKIELTQAEFDAL